MRKFLKYALIALIVFFISGQFIRVERTNPAIDPSRTIQARLHVTGEVNRIFDRACGDCHSNETKWPWYANVAPVSWLVSHDVSEGRREMNLSDWARFDQKKADRRLRQICSEVREGAMPPWYYVVMHVPAQMTKEDQDTLCAWATDERAKIAAVSASAPVRE